MLFICALSSPLFVFTSVFLPHSLSLFCLSTPLFVFVSVFLPLSLSLPLSLGFSVSLSYSVSTSLRTPLTQTLSASLSIHSRSLCVARSVSLRLSLSVCVSLGPTSLNLPPCRHLSLSFYVGAPSSPGSVRPHPRKRVGWGLGSRGRSGLRVRRPSLTLRRELESSPGALGLLGPERPDRRSSDTDPADSHTSPVNSVPVPGSDSARTTGGKTGPTTGLEDLDVGREGPGERSTASFSRTPPDHTRDGVVMTQSPPTGAGRGWFLRSRVRSGRRASESKG